jgi:hypothetical protein
MRLSSQSSAFVFNLPSDIVPVEISSSYTPLLEKNWVQYSNVIDYINSTIKSVTFPGISITTPEQTLVRGKTRKYKPAGNVQDIFGARALDITFRSVDSDLNYMLVMDIFIKNYLDIVELYINPFIISALDIHRDEIYKMVFTEIIATDLSALTFDYSQQRVNTKEFTLSISFNFMEIEFMLDGSKVLEVQSVPPIIQKL